LLEILELLSGAVDMLLLPGAGCLVGIGCCRTLKTVLSAFRHLLQVYEAGERILKSNEASRKMDAL
jgi:hypothetical protein